LKCKQSWKINYRALFLIKISHLKCFYSRFKRILAGNYRLTRTESKEENHTVSIREALKGVPPSIGQKYTENKRKIMQHIPEGGYWRDLPQELQKSYMGGSFHLPGGKTGMARRLAWDEPSLTLTCNPAQKQTERCHPEQTRPLTVREYARIQSFPDEWAFTGSMASQYRQIGNAVPVNMGFHIGKTLIATLQQQFDESLDP